MAKSITFDPIAIVEALQKPAAPFFSFIKHHPPQDQPKYYQWDDDTMPSKRAIIETITAAEDLIYCPGGTYRTKAAAVMWARQHVEIMPTPPRPPEGSSYVIGIVRANNGGPTLGWRLQNQ